MHVTLIFCPLYLKMSSVCLSVCIGGGVGWGGVGVGVGIWVGIGIKIIIKSGDVYIKPYVVAIY